LLEHSLDIQIPFLQRALTEGSFSIVPSSPSDSPRGLPALAQAIQSILDADTVVIASSDSHTTAVRMATSPSLSTIRLAPTSRRSTARPSTPSRLCAVRRCWITGLEPTLPRAGCAHRSDNVIAAGGAEAVQLDYTKSGDAENDYTRSSATWPCSSVSVRPVGQATEKEGDAMSDSAAHQTRRRPPTRPSCFYPTRRRRPFCE